MGVGMERRILFGFAIILLFCSSVILIGIMQQGIVDPGNENPEDEGTGNEDPDIYEFEWAVDVGDTFNFQIIVTGMTIFDFAESGPPPYIECNESMICAEVTYLPRNTTSLDNATLLSEIILPIKFNCTFENSSALPEPLHGKLIRLLSWTIVPLDNWELLHSSYYKNNFLELRDYVGQEICSSKMDDSSLNITVRKQRNWLHPGAVEIWGSPINMTTGLPYLMVYSDASITCDGEGYTVSLVLHQIE